MARQLVKKIYELTSVDRFSRDFGLREQIQRSAVSIVSNIAEGFERKTTKEFVHFLYTSKGSCGELRSHLCVALDLNYIERSNFKEVYALCEKISKSLAGFIKYLKSSNLEIFKSSNC